MKDIIKHNSFLVFVPEAVMHASSYNENSTQNFHYKGKGTLSSRYETINQDATQV